MRTVWCGWPASATAAPHVALHIETNGLLETFLRLLVRRRLGPPYSHITPVADMDNILRSEGPGALFPALRHNTYSLWVDRLWTLAHKNECCQCLRASRSSIIYTCLDHCFDNYRWPASSGEMHICRYASPIRLGNLVKMHRGADCASSPLRKSAGRLGGYKSYANMPQG